MKHFSNISVPGITRKEREALSTDEVKNAISALADEENPKTKHDCHGAMLRAGITDGRRRDQLMASWAQRERRNRGDM